MKKIPKQEYTAEFKEQAVKRSQDVGIGVAARELGWLDTALMCTHEMAVPGSLERCVRVLIHWNSTRRADQIIHVYIRGARWLRPELAAALPALLAAKHQAASEA